MSDRELEPPKIKRKGNKFMLPDPDAIKILTEEELDILAEELEDEMLQEGEEEGDGINKNSSSSRLYKKVRTKVVLGKNKVIYKMKGSQKEYVKSKGFFVHITEYKKKSK